MTRTVLKTVGGVLVMSSLLCALERPARATDEFPAIVQSTWNANLLKAVGGTRGCLLCHSDEVDTPPKAVTKPVGQWFYGQGLFPHDTSKLKELLATSKTEEQDSDGDGTSDYQELKDGTNPNVKNAPKPPPTTMMGDGGTMSDAAPSPVVTPSAESTPPLLQTGCSCTLGAKHESGAGAVAFLFAFVLVVARRRGTTLASRT